MEKHQPDPYLQKVKDTIEQFDIPDEVVDSFMKRHGLKKRDKEHILEMTAQRMRKLKECNYDEGLVVNPEDESKMFYVGLNE